MRNIEHDVLTINAILKVFHHGQQHLARDLELAIARIAEGAGAGNGDGRGAALILQGHMQAGQKSHGAGMRFGV